MSHELWRLIDVKLTQPGSASDQTNWKFGQPTISDYLNWPIKHELSWSIFILCFKKFHVLDYVRGSDLIMNNFLMISNILTYFELRFGTCSMFYENINDKLKAPKTRLFMRKLLIQKTSLVHSGRLQRVRMNGLKENDGQSSDVGLNFKFNYDTQRGRSFQPIWTAMF